MQNLHGTCHDNSKKVLGAATCSGRHSALAVRNGREDVEALDQVLAHVHDGGHVSTPVTVIGSAPDGDDGLVREVPLVAFINELMSAGNQL